MINYVRAEVLVGGDTDQRQNPLKDRPTANITLKENEKGYIEIFSLHGKKSGTYNVAEGKNELDLSNIHYGSGVYFYRVWVNGEIKNIDRLIILQ